MLFQRVNRSNPEKIFIVAKNSYSTASLTNGQAVIWDWTTDGDGVGVTLATARPARAALKGGRPCSALSRSFAGVCIASHPVHPLERSGALLTPHLTAS